MAPQGELVGRDTFYRLIDENNLKIRRSAVSRAPRIPPTAADLPNLIKGFIPTAPNQLWVSDITYIEVWNGDKYYFVYLSLILDAYSKEIIG
jgi:putative transposase